MALCKRKNMSTLDKIIENRSLIKSLCARFGAKHIRVFGSVARQEDTEESDIDFIVELPGGYDLFKQRMPLTDALKRLLDKDIDLIPEHELNQYLRESVLSEAIAL